MASLKVCMLLLKLNLSMEKINGIFFSSGIWLFHSLWASFHYFWTLTCVTCGPSSIA